MFIRFCGPRTGSDHCAESRRAPQAHMCPARMETGNVSAPRSRLGTPPGREPGSWFQRPLSIEPLSPGPDSPSSVLLADTTLHVWQALLSGDSDSPCAGLRPHIRAQLKSHHNGNLHFHCDGQNPATTSRIPGH